MVELVRFQEHRGLRIVRGEMQYVWDDKGNRYLDAHTGHGVAFLGHSNPRIVEALCSQARKIMTLTPAFTSELEEELSERLSQIAPRGLGSVFFQNSGAEAVEAALKLAWAYTGRIRIVAFKNSFHGRTHGALSLTWNPKYRKGFPLMGEVVFTEYNAPQQELEKVIDDSVAAVVVEPVQGEGGIVPAKPEFLQSLRKLTREAGALLVMDEIQAGFGRTGHTWAHEPSGIEPDILLAGKSVGGGFPVSLVFTRPEVAESLKGGRHGSTFAASPLAQAAVLGALRVFSEDHVPQRVREGSRELGDLLKDRVAATRPVRGTRLAGYMVGVELRFPPGKAIRCLQTRGVLALKAGATVVRFLPPYMITSRDRHALVGGLRECLCGEYGC